MISGTVSMFKVEVTKGVELCAEKGLDISLFIVELR